MILAGEKSVVDVEAILHGLAIIITGVSAVIAAVSSLLNGKKLRESSVSNASSERKAGSKSTASGFEEYRPKHEKRPDYDR